jgi:hypothetical protein
MNHKLNRQNLIRLPATILFSTTAGDNHSEHSTTAAIERAEKPYEQVHRHGMSSVSNSE